MQLFVRSLTNQPISALNFTLATTAHDISQLYADTHGVCIADKDLRLVHHGRTLPNDCVLATAGVSSGSTLDLLPRLRGGGGDGGSTGAESRSAYLAMYAQPKGDKANPEEERLARWSTCQLSGLPLQPPIVCDEIGNLYNKDAVVQALLNKTMPKQLSYITSLKHLIDLKVDATINKPGEPATFACLVSGVPFNGKSNFTLVRPGGKGPGYVFSDKALKEAKVAAEDVVGGTWTAEETMKLVPFGQELESLRVILTAKRDAEKAERKNKKNSKRSATETATTADADTKNGTTAVVNGGKGGGGGLKRSKIVEELMPAGADPAVWKSLFRPADEVPDGKNQAGKNKKGNNDYMVRGGLKWVM